MERVEKQLNLAYAANQGTYWMIYGVICGFVSVFLLAYGYSNTEIGIIIAVSNIAAMILQPLAADVADRLKKISLLSFTGIFGIILLLSACGLLLFPHYGLLQALFYIGVMAWMMMIQPLLNSLNFKLQDCGAYVDFGICRSGGSLGYAVLVVILGILIERYGAGMVPLGAIATVLLFLLSLLFTGKSYQRVKTEFPQIAPKQADNGETQRETISLLAFLKGNPLFLLLHLGILCLFFGYSVLSSYLAQIITFVGGSSADLGRIMGITAIVEVPILIFFGFLMRRFSCRFLLKVAAIAYTVKILIFCLAHSVLLLYLAQSVQMFGYSLFLPAMVYFIDDIMLPGEAVKGQAVFTMTSTAATILAGFFGGILLDSVGVRTLLIISTGISVIGTAMILTLVNRLKRKNAA